MPSVVYPSRIDPPEITQSTIDRIRNLWALKKNTAEIARAVGIPEELIVNRNLHRDPVISRGGMHE